MRNLDFLVLLPAMFIVTCSDGKGAEADFRHAGRGTVSIASVQGSATESPLAGRNVTVEGIVTGDFQDHDADGLHDLGGFFLQGVRGATNPRTSDGIFVFEGRNANVDVQRGDKVAVTGRVQEHFGETQIKAVEVSLLGNGDVQPIDIDLPAASLAANSDGEFIADLERYEGMLVRFPQTLTVTGLFDLERYGAIRLSQGGRLFQFSNDNAPDERLYVSHRKDNAARSITLDDGRRTSNARPIAYLAARAAATTSIRVGDRVSGLTGNLRYSRGSGGSGSETWRLMPTSDPLFVNSNPRPAAPEVEGSVKVASFNVLNYFSTVDTGEGNCGPDGDSGCRGADSVAERSRQLQKITAALAMIDADIVGLIELENNASGSLTDIVNALNASMGGGTYASLQTGRIGNDAIKTGFVYKPATVRPSGAFAILDAGVDPHFNDGRNRPALAQTFAATSNGGRLTAVLNHLKSKGSGCESDGDPNTGDGQGNCNRTRTDAARAIVDWLAGDPTSSGDPDYLIIGDINAYREEDPLRAFEDAGYVNLVTAGTGAYSFVYHGQAGALDHALASPGLAAQVNEAIAWHINADEAPLHDYNLERGRDPAIFDSTTPYRSSDHDPIIVGIDIN